MLMVLTTFVSVAGTMNSNEANVEKQSITDAEIEFSHVVEGSFIPPMPITMGGNRLNTNFPTESSFGKNKAALHPSENPPFTVNNGYHEGWPQIIIGTPHYWGGIISPVVADLDNDGSKELIVTQQGEPSRVYVFEQNGSLKFDVIEMPSACPFISPRRFSSIDDIDNDGFKEIIFETKGYNEYRFMIYSHNGTLKDEWNIGNYQVSDSLYGSIVLADLDFDNAMEIIYGGWVGGTGNDGPSLVVLDNEGNYKPGFPVRLENIQMAETNTPAVGNFDGDADLEIVVISHENNQPVKKTNIRAFDTNGSLLWAQELDSIVYGDPAVGDINHDGFDEVVFTSPKGVHILDRHGEYLVNKYLGHDNGDSSNIALADLDGDENLEVIFGYWGSIYVMDQSGSILWSYDTGWNAHYPPVVGDITGDGIPDIVATSDFEVWAWNSQGGLLSGFPKPVEINAYGACSLDDIDNDGDVELIASSDWKWNDSDNEGYIYVWDTPGIYNASSVEWPMYQHDIGHTGSYPKSDELIANAGGPYFGLVDTTVQFMGYGFGGSLPYSWFWEFGDGTNSTEQNPEHIYSGVEVYNVTFTVTDSGFNSSNDTTTATIIAEEELVADANGPYEGMVGEPVSFSGNASGGFPPYSWFWEFGDSTNSTEQNPEHTYSIADIYNVIFTVTDSSFNSSNDTTTATIVMQQLVADADGPYVGVVGVPVQFSGNASGGLPPYSWFWEFDDGNSSEEQNSTHTYSATDTYTVTLTVTDSALNSDDDTTTATIAAGEPRLEIGTITGGLFKVHATIKNTGDVDATVVNWSITFNGGIILLGKETTGGPLGIPAGGEATISSRFILGFGKTVITVSAETADSSDTAERDAFVLLFLIK